MPDRYGERPDPQLGDNDTPDELPHYGPTDTELRAQAIADCNLCDNEGTRNAFPCDHIDHTPANKRGIAAIRAQMGWNNQPPQNQPENPSTGQPDGKTTPL